MFILRRSRALIVLLALNLCGCATYQAKVDAAREKLAANQPVEAAALLKPLAEKENDDQLIFVFDYATALQAAGDYKLSSAWFEKSMHIADENDYTSVTRQAGSLLFSQEMVQYKGEDFERLFIHVMLALNYLAMGDLEGANVETRRLNEKLNYYRLEEKKPYEQNPFAFYISGHIWEANKNWDSAFIDFSKAYKIDPNLKALQEDLVRTAWKSRRMDEYEKYSKKFGIQKRKEWENPKYGELVVFYLQGWGPRKAPRPEAQTFPHLVPVRNITQQAQVEVIPDLNANEKSHVAVVGNATMKDKTELAYDVQAVAIKTLDDDYASLVAKRAAAFVTKQVVASQIGQRNEALGLAALIAMHVSDRADLRQWSTLPQTIQVARMYLPVGEYKVIVRGLRDNGSESGEVSQDMKVKVEPRQKSFVTWRSWQ